MLMIFSKLLVRNAGLERAEGSTGILGRPGLSEEIGE